MDRPILELLPVGIRILHSVTRAVVLIPDDRVIYRLLILSLLYGFSIGVVDWWLCDYGLLFGRVFSSIFVLLVLSLFLFDR